MRTIIIVIGLLFVAGGGSFVTAQDKPATTQARTRFPRAEVK